MRKRFWIAAVPFGLVLAVLWIVQFGPDPVASARKRLADAGRPSSFEMLNLAYKEPAPNDNAALLILQAQGLYRKPGDTVPLLGTNAPTRGTVWSETMRASAHAFLKDNQEALKLLKQAAERPECRFPIDLTEGASTSLSHLGIMKTAVWLHCLKAELAMEEGRVEDSASALVDGLRLMGHLESEPLLISQLLRIAGIHISIFSLERMLHRGALPVEALEELEGLFRRSLDHQWMEQVLNFEYLIGLQMFEGGLSPSPENKWLISYAGPFNSQSQFRTYALLGFKRSDRKHYIQTMNHLLDTAHLQDTERLAAVTNRLPTLDGLHRTLSKWLLSGLEDHFKRELRLKARLQLCLAACALERYRATESGSLPETLDLLVPEYLPEIPEDPWDGLPIRYRRLAQDKGYLLYSVGESGVDNGGMVRLKFERIPAEVIHETLVVEHPARN